ncbi:MAG TPA: hypothetical protein DIW50_17480 [Prolixibacteraceae bacterium]|nr:MAG: hypothetical protein A2W92_20340 [Bacteroidetes bacterium GWA2_42_15]HCR92201.1 hypothetical protein [Prolixibacteraceae bacterium]
MKFNFLKNALIISISVLLISGCGQSSKVKEGKGTTSDGKEASVEVETFDVMKIKDQIVEIINNSPKAPEVADFINKVGASYILDLTVPIDDVEKFMTKTQMGLGLGMYAFDLNYAKTFNRGDMVLKTTELEQQLLEKLGLQNEFTSQANYTKRLQDNAENKDSIDNLVNQIMNLAHQKFTTSNQPDTYALSFIGANIEALYILSQLSLFAQDNKPMIEFIGKQGERAKSIFSLLELMSGDQNVKPYYEKMKTIADYFEQHPTFTEKELNEISPMIESFRNEIFK